VGFAALNPPYVFRTTFLERNLRAAGGGPAFALVAHRRAFAGDKELHIRHRPVLQAHAEDTADRSLLARRRKRQVLRQQHRIDGRIAEPIEPDDAGSHRRLERSRDGAQLDLGALLQIVDGAAADAQVLHRARFAKAVEPAADITQPQPRRGGYRIERNVVAVNHFGADEPAAIACGGVLKARRHGVIGDAARALVVDAAAIEREQASWDVADSGLSFERALPAPACPSPAKAPRAPVIVPAG
jgi:hypothetical protein